MEPIAFQLGSLTVRWYGVMAACGFISAIFLLDANRKIAKLSEAQATMLLIISLFCGILGARIFYCIQFFREFRYDLWRMIRIDQGGLVFYGGFILALIAIIIYTLRHSLDTIRVMDVLVPSLAAAHGFGRIGCFLNGCCYGRPTTSWWGIRPPQGSLLELLAGSEPLHPVQLVEAGENFLLCAFFFFLLRHSKRGVVMSSYLLIYGFLRFFNETLRGDNVLFFHLTPAQWIGLALIPAGAGLLWYFLKNERKNS